MYFTIYKTTNKINGKFYIGKHHTKNLDDGYLGSGKLLKRDLQKYGEENFEKKILHIFETEEEMNQKEKELVEIGPHTYNLLEGGTGGFGYINKNGYTNKNKDYIKSGKAISKSLKGKPLTEKQLNALRQAYKDGKMEKSKISMLGKKHSDEAKRKIGKKNSIHQQGMNNSQYGKCWIYHPIEKISKSIDKNDLNKYAELGYVKGRILFKS